MMNRGRRARRAGRRDAALHRRDPSLQQGAAGCLLPRVEAGDIVLIGATRRTSFEVNSALLSRSKVPCLKALGLLSRSHYLRRTVDDDERGLGRLRWMAMTRPDSDREV